MCALTSLVWWARMVGVGPGCCDLGPHACLGLGGRALGLGVGTEKDPQAGDLLGAERRRLGDDLLHMAPVALLRLVASGCRFYGFRLGVHTASRSRAARRL